MADTTSATPAASRREAAALQYGDEGTSMTHHGSTVRSTMRGGLGDPGRAGRLITVVVMSLLTSLMLAPPAAPIVLAAPAVGSLTGQVLDPRTSPAEGLSGITVTAQPVTSCGVAANQSSVTNGEGVYSFPGLPPGTYRINLQMPSTLPSPQYAPGTLDYSAASIVTVEAGATTTVPSFTAVGGGSVTGIVTRAAGGTPIAGATVGVLALRNYYVQTQYGYTGSDGTFRVDGVAPGDAVALVKDYGGQFAFQYSDGSPGPKANVAPFSVTAGAVTSGVDFAVLGAAQATGRVVDASGPVSGISVTAYRVAGLTVDYDAAAYATTSEDGTFSVGGLAPGTYRVDFRDYRVTASLAPTTRSSIIVTDGGTTPLGDELLPLGGTITGTLVDQTGAPLTDTWVSASADVGYGSARTDSNGAFTIASLPAGSYRVSTFVAGRSTYWPGVTNYSDATLVDVSLGTTQPLGDFPVAVTGCSPVSIEVAVTPTPLSAGQTATAAVKISGEAGPVPSGQVTIREGSTVLGTGVLNAAGEAAITLSALTAGTHILQVGYSGDTEYAASDLYPQLEVLKTATTTELTAQPSASSEGQVVTLRASVEAAAGSPSGTVEFSDGAAVLGYADLLAGVATFTTRDLAAGDHALSAAYLGDASYEASSAGTVDHTVEPVARGVLVKVEDESGAPVADAQVSVVDVDGNSRRATTDAAGMASVDVAGLTEGAATLNGYATGYRPGRASTPIPGGVDRITLVLQSGPLGSATLTSSRLTPERLTELGVDLSDPANSHVETFKINIPGVGVLCGVANNAGLMTLDGVTDPDCGTPVTPTSSCVDSDGRSYCIQATSTSVGVLEAPGVRFLKEFFDVQLTVFNLSDPGFPFDPGTATLALPSGLSLAPTSAGQSATAAVAAVDGGASGSASWIVRGDTGGTYDLTAGYSSVLKVAGLDDVPVQFDATTRIKVWAGDAVELLVQAEDAAYAHHPYRVRLGLKNVSDVPVYLAGVGLSRPAGTPTYIFQPDQTMLFSTPRIDAGQTWWSGDFILLTPGSSPVDISQIAVTKLGGDATLTPRVSGVPAKNTPDTAPNITATPGIEEVSLAWDPVPGASEYRIYTTSSDLTAFGAAPVATVDAGTTEATIDAVAGDPVWYAVSPVIEGLAAMHHEMIQATAKVKPAAATPGNGSQSGGAAPRPTESPSNGGSGDEPNQASPPEGRPATTPVASRPKCEKVLFIGARGSGQKAGSADGRTNMGAQVYHVWRQVRRSLGSRATYLAVPKPPYSARAVGVIYTNPYAYFTGMEVGVDWVLSELRARQKPCPSERIILSGYSQGAMVMHRVLEELDNPWIIDTQDRSILRRIDGAVLIADGDRIPGEQTTNYGSAGRGTGIGYNMRAVSGTRAAPLSEGLLSRVHSICNKNDVVCDHRPAWHTSALTIGAGVLTHTDAYVDSADVRLAASRVARRAGERMGSATRLGGR
jgi:hypothetical protein